MEKKEIFKQENEYLSKILSNIDLEIKDVEDDHDYYQKQIDDIGIPDKEDKGIRAKYVRSFYACAGKKIKLVNLKKCPHFGRMDLKFTEENKGDSLVMYIGEKGISDTNQRTLVYDWRSPVANLYYMANQTTFKFNETSYELHLKRQIEIENSKLIDCYDLYEFGNSVDVTDTFLLKVLEQKKSRNEFSDIIRTIQSNQNNIIRDDISNNSVVQGVAGSGKTVILLHKISYLLYNNPNINSNKIIFITPSEIFKSKLAAINRSLSLTNILMTPMEQYYLEKIKLLIPGIKLNNIVKDDPKNGLLLTKVYSDDFNKTISDEIYEYFNDYVYQLKRLNLSFEISNIYNSLTQINNKIKKILDNDEWNTFEQRDHYKEIQNNTKELMKRDNVKKIADLIYQKLRSEFNIKKYINIMHLYY